MSWNNLTCPKCGAYTEYCDCPKTVTAAAPINEPTPPGAAPPAIVCSAWVEELAKEMERTKKIHWDQYEDNGLKYHEGYADALTDFVKRLRACARSSSTKKVSHASESGLKSE